MKTRTLLAAALLFATGCAGPVVVDGRGDADRLYGDWTICRQETLGYAFIPDFGIASRIAENSCMEGRGWGRVNSPMGWQWIGTAK